MSSIGNRAGLVPGDTMMSPIAGSVISEDDVLLRIGEVEERAGLSRSTIYKRMGEGTFPAAVQLGGGVVRWRRSEIRAWQQALPAREAAPPAPAAMLPEASAGPAVRRRGRPRKPLAAGHVQ
ncbi:helix-turn-helix transcriptional regulator [Roseomonas sp. WA12]